MIIEPTAGFLYDKLIAELYAESKLYIHLNHTLNYKYNSRSKQIELRAK